jgi:DNA-binding transcriptional LysR family regulator
MMNEIQLHRLDLNLLVTFQALMDARSVTIAADKLGKTPSAVSHALGRLREQLDDPLMIKVGGKMQPSPFALQLIEDVRPILRSIQRVVSPPQPFDPAKSRRIFRLALPTMPGLMSRVFERISAEAPDVALEWTSPSQRAYGQVAEGLVDIAMLGSGNPMPDGVTEKIMPPLRVYVFARSGHPALQNWGREAWLKWPHIMISLGTAARTSVDEQALKLGLERRIGALIPDFGAAAPLLARTNLLFNNFSISLIDDIDVHNLQVLQSPIGRVAGTLRFMWSSRLANDPGQQWLRRTVIECYEELVRFAESKFAQTTITLPGE